MANSDLIEAVEEMVAVVKGEVPAARESHYDGHVLVRIFENGVEVWNIDGAAKALSKRLDRSIAIKDIRLALKQSQSGFADLLGISKRTLQEWEQGRRKPNEAAKRLIYVAALNPGAVMQASQIAA